MYMMQHIEKTKKAPGGWSVMPPSGIKAKGLVVCDGLDKSDAALLVHYLNGGSVDTSMQMHVMELIKKGSE
jgi:hypothetical protein